MKFIHQFNTIINDQNVHDEIDFFMKIGKTDSQFLNYFGINYSDETLISVKFYFSFFDRIPSEILKRNIFSKKDIELIERYWGKVKHYSYLHQGLTFGIKCYWVKGEIKIHYYFHFRSKKIPFKQPKHSRINEDDLLNPLGICVETNDTFHDLKRYYYIQDKSTQKTMLQELNLSEEYLESIETIEYTESNLNDRKVNLIINNLGVIENYLSKNDNPFITDLSSYFHKNHKLYFYGPGIRFNKPIHAIYYLPKEALEGGIKPFSGLKTISENDRN